MLKYNISRCIVFLVKATGPLWHVIMIAAAVSLISRVLITEKLNDAGNTRRE